MAFDPTTATLDKDPDSDNFAEWVKRSSPGVKASARKQAAEGIIAAIRFKKRRSTRKRYYARR